MDASMKPYIERGHLVIERVSPEIDGGRFRAKAIAGDDVRVEADVLRDGPALLHAVIRYRGPKDRRWKESPMSFVADDRWVGTFQPTEIGRYEYTIQAWTDRFGTWRRDMEKRVAAEQN